MASLTFWARKDSADTISVSLFVLPLLWSRTPRIYESIPATKRILVSVSKPEKEVAGLVHITTASESFSFKCHSRSKATGTILENVEGYLVLYSLQRHCYAPAPASSLNYPINLLSRVHAVARTEYSRPLSPPQRVHLLASSQCPSRLGSNRPIDTPQVHALFESACGRIRAPRAHFSHGQRPTEPRRTTCLRALLPFVSPFLCRTLRARPTGTSSNANLASHSILPLPLASPPRSRTAAAAPSLLTCLADGDNEDHPAAQSLYDGGGG
ncbi:hypothetical protein B0H13DRAFT_2348735 [Mycena leptocephala]|nr:hypothetical protein B0H13DRAFT_2348735 [Mycena leptocephala]